MAWRITDSLITAELDNREEGRVTGSLHLMGREDPIRLELEGNFLRDIAGCRITIRNPHPLKNESTDLAPLQQGQVGDMTASHKVRVIDVSVDKALQLRSKGQSIPEHWGNCVVLEWFSEANGRVVIENIDFHISTSEPAWTPSPEPDSGSVADFFDLDGKIVDELPASIVDALDLGAEAEDGFGLDEFAWEREFRESDERTADYLRLMEQYKDDPDRDARIAKEMGWDPSVELVGELVEWDDLEEIAYEPDPAPETEGTLWIRSEDDRIVHPLYNQSYKISMDLWMLCEHAGLLNENGNEQIRIMVECATQFTTKLAGALNCLHLDPTVDPGFTIALLKRSLPIFNNCMNAMDQVKEAELIPQEILTPIGNRLHEVRQEILRLMERLRDPK